MHLEQPPVPLIKSNNNTKLDKDCVKIKFHRYPTPEKSDLYELKMALFDNGKPKGLLLFINKLQTTFESSVTLTASANIHYRHTVLCGKLLR